MGSTHDSKVIFIHCNYIIHPFVTTKSTSITTTIVREEKIEI